MLILKAQISVHKSRAQDLRPYNGGSQITYPFLGTIRRQFLKGGKKYGLKIRQKT
jgi:hypothetical protein